MSDPKQRKIGKIVFDRPPFKTGRFFMFAGIGLLVGLLFGIFFWWRVNGQVGEIAEVLLTRQCWPYLTCAALLGLLGGMIVGWGWKRAVQARVEMVDPPAARRRTSTSTAMARVEISGRSRF